jgi:redox-sensitive bicupin YhaK (pirin superfamily)
MAHPILRNEALSRPWPGTDPFLFCAHHLDRYPAAQADQGLAPQQLGGRALGSDFSRLDGFSMYHGTRVPGFPAHPHRGFETVTIVPNGLVDHADSLGATARYGDGDVQWLTAGRGILHAEMFPLRDTQGGNLLELYQIWLNLPARDKMVEPAFAMLWDERIPRYRTATEDGAVAEVKVIAGRYQPQEQTGPALQPPPPAPNSWAADPAAELAIWQLTLAPGARLTLPAATLARTRRTLYAHTGEQLEVAGQTQQGARLVEVDARTPLLLVNRGTQTAEVMVLQGVPLNEPVVAQGPFVMNTQAEIEQTQREFARTRFGGWPWPDAGPVHPAEQARFAKLPDGAQLTPSASR